jgi:hypothetical protein
MGDLFELGGGNVQATERVCQPSNCNEASTRVERMKTARTKTPKSRVNRNSGLKAKSHSQPPPTSLRGWQQIAEFLGQRISVAERWAKTGMPVTREGRFVTASFTALNEWLGRESGGEPVHVVTPQTDLSAELKRGLRYVRRERSSVKDDRRG